MQLAFWVEKAISSKNGREKKKRERGMEFGVVLSEVREAYKSERTRSFAWRQSQLKALLRLLYDKEEDIFTALAKDLGKHRVEAYRDEIGVLIKSINFALDNLKKWMAPTKVNVPLVAFPTSGQIVPEPLGLVLIFSSWNFPIGLSIEPLIGAISAGNAVVLKPSELSPASSEFLCEHLAKYLDNKVVRVIQGGSQVGEQLLQHKWDKIFFTGSPRVGRIIMKAAADHLTPVDLELGSKCPAIFDSLTRTRDIEMAVRRLVGGKWGPCCGQACIGVDYVLVEDKLAPMLIDLLRTVIKKFCIKPDHVSRIVNENHFRRLKDLLSEPSVEATCVHGGSMNLQKLSIEPTILLNPPLDSKIMTEEIFGPILPIITLKKIEDSIQFINERPKPLVIYAFTNDEKLKERIIAETSSGGVTFNDTIVQYAMDTLPFGGVGQSGFGKYHGKFSFDAFSHKKAVLRRTFFIDLSLRYPPWNETKLRMIRDIYHFDYFSLLLRIVGFKRS